MLPAIPLTGSASGIVLKELVRRAIQLIRTERMRFEIEEKNGYDGAAGDMVTSADKKAQELYLRSFLECFPGVGIVGEEANLQAPCTIPGIDVYLTVDPVDGTKALVRKQSHGVATMIAFVVDGVIVSAWVGDVNTREIYGYRPDSENVHRITDLDIVERLTMKPAVPLERSHLLLHDPIEKYGPSVRELVQRVQSYEVMGGSIGTWASRIWKGEVDLCALPASYETPWDSTPVFGISEKMEFAFATAAEGGPWRTVRPVPPRLSPERRDEDLIFGAPALLAEITG